MISIHQWTKWLSKGNSSIPVLLLENYKKLNMTDAEMMLIIHLNTYASQGVDFPSFEQLQERMTCSTEQLSSLFNRLHKEKYLEIQTYQSKDGMMGERYSLEPLWEKLVAFLTLEESTALQETAATSELQETTWPPEELAPDRQKKLEGEVYRRFEQEFGRPLSPMECETIGYWLDEDHYDIQFIFLALREAVISGKLSLRYIDRILFEWKKNGFKTVEQIKDHAKKFRQQSKQKSKEQPEASKEFSFYNWLEN